MQPARLNRWPLWSIPLLAMVLVAAWQWTTVQANFRGNWTALFCTGAAYPQPSLATTEHIYLFEHSTGHDGQLYHYVAHDPFMRSDLKTYVDAARMRYRRVLVPFAAYAVALGHSELIDAAYIFVCLLSIGLGVYWSCRFAQDAGLTAAWGLLFLLTPAATITMDRLVVDGALAALTAAFLCYSRSASSKLFAVLACAALTRETGLLLMVAYCAYLVWQRSFRLAGYFLLSALPAAAWYGYVHLNTTAFSYGVARIPFSSILWVLGNPWTYPPGTPLVGVVLAADYLALAGVILGFAFAVLWFVRGPCDTARIFAALFGTLELAFQRPDHWQNVYDFGRVYAPVLVCLGAIAAQRRNPWLLVPGALMLPRIAIQLAPQALGIVRWLA